MADFKCEDCDRSFNSKTLLRKHYEVNHKKKFSCYKCNKCFETQVLMKKHFEKHVLKGGKTFQCETCKKNSLAKKALIIIQKPVMKLKRKLTNAINVKRFS